MTVDGQQLGWLINLKARSTLLQNTGVIIFSSLFVFFNTFLAFWYRVRDMPVLEFSSWKHGAAIIAGQHTLLALCA